MRTSTRTKGCLTSIALNSMCKFTIEICVIYAQIGSPLSSKSTHISPQSHHTSKYTYHYIPHIYTNYRQSIRTDTGHAIQMPSPAQS